MAKVRKVQAGRILSQGTVYTVFYSILLYISLCRSDIARPYIYIFLIQFHYLDLCVLGICCTVVRYLSNNTRGGVVYERRKAECLDTAVSRGILAIYHKPLRCIIAIINWLAT